ncbi:hypothetical protein Pcinc_040758 [Petrolisthes cinctipes]|uniref:Uncharacterized protein n=1 Tax=Petrolisthes cinctipes TaxID=88211 RepID=A0AAE1BL91_PETCI|nr:hypothetical protein Pcinc_040758 [Petrolisthes cinctipes]
MVSEPGAVMFPGGQQGGGGYLGYHAHHHHAHTQYPPDLACNFQSFMGEGWHPHHAHAPPVYMTPHAHHPAHTAHHAHPTHHAPTACQQRSPAAYEDWMTPLHHHGGASPLPQPPMPPQPHTPSPCAPPILPAPPSPSFTPYHKLPTVPHQQQDYNEGVGGASPHQVMAPALPDTGGEGGSPAGPLSQVPPTRPHQARSPYEWMKKPSYQAQVQGQYL